MPTLERPYRLPASLPEDLERLREAIARFATGEITAAEFHPVHVALGIYEQREGGAYMLRGRLPAGLLLPDQMRAAAAVALTYGDGRLHLTSRQNVQVHGVPLASLHMAAVALADAGLSVKSGGGNTVRSIAVCPHAGVCAEERFDVTAQALALNEALQDAPNSVGLPRKYKIAFSGCGQDCAAATVADVGFIAAVLDGIDGYAVYVGGGMGTHSRVGVLLEPFVPAAEAPCIAEAVKRVFHAHGNRENRARARLRFLLEEVGLDQFRAWYQEALAGIPSNPATPAHVSCVPTPTATLVAPAPGFDAWRAAQVTPQRQSGYAVVEISPRLGLIGADQLTTLADIIERFGEGVLRTTNWQGVLLRWVAEEQLPALHAALAVIGLDEARPAVLRHLTVCTGAGVCRLGIGLSRDLAEAVTTALEDSGLDLAALGDLRLHISGCTNACGRHPVADIGLYGTARRVDGTTVPHYVLQLGGHVEDGKTVLASGTTAVPADQVPAVLVRLLAAFAASGTSDFDAFLAAGGRALVDAA
jgi:sulfite reductase beta subunit-like hemoprotein